jgi:two-component system OmpR family sensor kinase
MRHLLARTPLRVRLVAAVMALVTAALLVISVASAFFLRNYLVGRIDSQLKAVAQSVNVTVLQHADNTLFPLPTDYFAQLTSINGVGMRAYYDTQRLSADDLPPPLAGLANVGAVDGQPYTVVSPNGRQRWRMLVTQLPNGDVLHLGENLSNVDMAVQRLVTVESIVGGGTLVVLAIFGVVLVRTSLRPLREIERTAAAIADGDLTQRVPEFEPNYDEPRTEVGRLSRALNTMLGHIEAAFTARAESETAARAAESAARYAAQDAQLSETRARRSEERMRQFIADASHELRTPLTTIRGFAELYRQGAAREPNQAEKLVRRIEDEAARMGLLVDDLLLLARLDQERPLVPVPLELRVIAHDAVTAAQAIAPDREITLEIPEGTGPVEVLGDEGRLRQVIGNLMTNALTYTPPDSPIWLRLRREGEMAVIEIADRGPGLAPDQVDRVFERFYRADAARTRSAEGGPSSGTGLGLAIVAALVKAHNGSVEVDSAPGRGATFQVRLPIHS